MTFQKYSAALIHVAVVVLTALVASLDKGLTLAGTLQLAALTLTTLEIVLVPLLKSTTFKGELKVGGAVAGAIVTALIPLALNGWSFAQVTPAEWVTVVLAALGAIPVGVGVVARANPSTPVPPVTNVFNNGVPATPTM